LAALAVTGAFAQSSVTISGQLDAGLGVTQTAFSTSATSIGTQYGASRLRFVGTEDMGGGMKTNFLLEMQPNMNSGATSASLFNRGAWLGLSGGWGEFRLGRQGTTTIGVVCTIDQSGCYGSFNGGGILFSGFSTTAGALGAGAGNWFAANPSRGVPVTVALGAAGQAGTGLSVPSTAGDVTRVVGGITYLTPNFGGFTGQLQYAMGGLPTPASAADGATVGLQLAYGNGPIWVGLGYSTVNGYAASPASGTLTTLGGKYDFGVAAVALGYQKEGASANGGAGLLFTDATAYAVTVMGNMGAFKPYIKFGNRTVSGGAAGSITAAQVVNIGTTYALSKRTDIYADYAVDTATQGAVAGTSNPSNFALGIRHTF